MIQAADQQAIHPRLMTSALPAESDFAQMASEGYEVVISLAQRRDSTVIDNEDALVCKAGMRYIHLPIAWETPRLEDYALLSDLLRMLHDRKVWLHCTRNFRVSSLMYLYHIIELTMPPAEAEAILHRTWTPNDTWQALINETLEKYVGQYL